MASDWVTITENEALGGQGNNQWETISAPDSQWETIPTGSAPKTSKQDMAVNLAADWWRKLADEHPTLYTVGMAIHNADPFGFRSFALRHIAPHLPIEHPEILTAIGEGANKVQAETSIGSWKKYPGIAGKVGGAMAEFGAPFLPKSTAGKFAVTTAARLPTAREEEQPLSQTLKERAIETAQSALTGAGVGLAGRFIPNPLYRIPIVTGGFMGLTALEGGDANQILESGITVLGFEAVGLAQKGYYKHAVQAAIKKNPELAKVDPAMLEQKIKEVGGIGEIAAPSRERIETTAREIQKSKLTDFQKASALEELKKLLPIEDQLKDVGIIKQEQKPDSPFEISKSSARRLETAKKFEGVLTELETKRPELRKRTEEAREKELQQFNEIYKSLEEADPIIASRIARSKVKGFLREAIPELREQISRNEVVDLKQAVREADISPGQKLNLEHFFEDILAQRQPFRSHIKAFDRFFGTEILKKAPKPKAKGVGKWLSWAAEPFNITKAVVCSTDFSAGGIQALMVAPSHPVIWGKGVGKGYRAFFSPKYVNLTELEMKTNPHYRLIEEHGRGLLTEIGSKTKGEEFFVSELAHRIPLLGRLVRASDRAFVTTLNSIRSNFFYRWMEMNPGASNVQIKEMLDHIGNLTGRGRGKAGGKFEKFTPELGAVLWAPRLYLGTIKSMTDVISKPHIRKQAAGDLVRATGFLMGVLGLMSLLPDTDVELDPRSSDFGKIKHGNTRLAFFGRHTQMIRFVAQMISGQKKSTGTGRIHSRPRLQIASRYLRSKLNPMAGVGWDIATGKTFLGEKMEYRNPEFMTKYFAQHTVPMFLQDVHDAIRYQGLGTALATSPLGLHGIGMQTYEVRRAAESQRLKDHYAHMYFGTDWDQLGPDVQEALRDNQPLIGIYEDRARAEREQYVYEDWAQAEQRTAGQKVLKQVDKNVQAELKRLEMPFGGLSRRLSSDWMLNDQRYKEYQNKAAKLINEVVPGFIKSPMWSKLDPAMQREMLDQLLNDCKKAVRQQIVNDAKFADVQRIVGAM